MSDCIVKGLISWSSTKQNTPFFPASPHSGEVSFSGIQIRFSHPTIILPHNHVSLYLTFFLKNAGYWYKVMFTVLATWLVGATYTAWVGMSVDEGIIAMYALIYGMGGLVMYYILAPRIWQWGQTHNLFNLPDFIELRYGSKNLATLISIFGVLINFPWHVIGFKTFGYVAYSLTGGAIPFNLGMAIIVGLILCYVTYGGQRTVVTLDFIQGVVLTGFMPIVVTFVVYKLFGNGGYGAIFQEVAIKFPERLTVASPPYWSSINIAGIIGSYCWLEIFSRIFIAKSKADCRNVAAGAPFFFTIFQFTLISMCIGGVLFPEVVADSEAGFLTMFSMAGGPILLAFAAIAIIAAEMSSVDAQIITNSVVIANNIIRPYKSDMNDRQIIKLSRGSAFVFVVVALIVAMLDLPALIYLAIFSYECLVHLFPTIILGALWNRGNTKAALAGIICGLPITLYFTAFPDQVPAALGSWTPGILGFVINVSVYVIISLVSQPLDHVRPLFNQLKKQDALESKTV